MSLGPITDGRQEADRPALPLRPCVHCLRRVPALAGVRVVCIDCRATEAALNGGERPAVQVAYDAARPAGLQPWWTPAEDRVLARCRTAAEAHGRLPWRSKTACLYPLKVLRRSGRVTPYDHRVWTPAEDARVARCRSAIEIRAVARALGRTVAAVHRRRNELRQAGRLVIRIRRARIYGSTATISPSSSAEGKPAEAGGRRAAMGARPSPCGQPHATAG